MLFAVTLHLHVLTGKVNTDVKLNNRVTGQLYYIKLVFGKIKMQLLLCSYLKNSDYFVKVLLNDFIKLMHIFQITSITQYEFKWLESFFPYPKKKCEHCYHVY